jgi:phosphoribosylglycinamide formyltransferase 1
MSGKHGRGSNMAALHQAAIRGLIPDAQIVEAIGTSTESPAIERAESLGLTTSVLDSRAGDYEHRLLSTISSANPDAICLAGYMRKVPPQVVSAFRHKILNIHPGLLPAFAGKGMYGSHVHQAVLDYGAKITGCTVHLIDEDYDTGPIILQKAVPVLDDDTVDSLAERVLIAEHAAYPEALALMAQGRLTVAGRIVKIAPE